MATAYEVASESFVRLENSKIMVKITVIQKLYVGASNNHSGRALNS